MFGSILIGCGLLGNIMAIVVLSRPQMQSAFNQLLIALCFFDSVFLVVSVSEVGTSLELSSKCLFMKETLYDTRKKIIYRADVLNIYHNNQLNILCF